MITIVGSINIDTLVTVESFPKSGQNIIAKNIERNIGGKGVNAAIAIANLGKECSLIGAVGNDYYGKRVISYLNEKNVYSNNILTKNERTGSAIVVVNNEGENYILVDIGANDSISVNDIMSMERVIVESEIILFQLEINLDALSKLIEICKKHNKKYIIDAGPIRNIDINLFRGAYILSPNEKELESLVNKCFYNLDELKAQALILFEELELQNLIVKLGEKGVYHVSKNKNIYYPAYKVDAIDSTGSGDSFMAGLTIGLLENRSMDESIKIGMKAGAICATRKGTSNALPTIEDIKNFNEFLL